MIKQSSLLKWAQNGNKNINNGKISSKNVWIHPPEALVRGHVAYLVKFLGNTDVDSPKGIEVVKEGITKLKFNQHLKRAEGSKTPKVELTISIDGVAIQEPKSKRICHQFPLHRISYCADDKSEKKFFSFIAKESDSEKHFCFVFVSDKLAEEITLTIGQAFDLAYRKFLESSGRDLEMKRQLMILQKRVRELELENCELKAKINESQQNGNNSKHKSSENCDNYAIHDLNNILNGESDDCINKKGIPQLLPALQPPPSANPRALNRSLTGNQSINLLDLDITQTKPTVGRKLENLNFDENEEEFNPRAIDGNESNESTVKEYAKNGHSTNGLAKDMFGSEPFTCQTGSKDPFGMGQFAAQELETAIGAIDKKLAEMRDGFSRGLSFGNEEFTVETMDPLN